MVRGHRRYAVTGQRWLRAGRLALAIGVGSVGVAGCGGDATAPPTTPKITSALACLHRHGLVTTEVAVSRLRSFTPPAQPAAVPVAEVRVVRPGLVPTRLLIAYFATPAQATAAFDDPALIAAKKGLEFQQAGRVLVIDYYPLASNQTTMFKARYCTTGLPVPAPPNS